MAFYLLILLVVLAILLYLLLTQPAKRLASLLVNGGPLLLIGIGALLTIFRRGLIGMPLMFIGIKWWRHSRTTRPFKRQKERKSTVRSSSLEMELDHDTGELDGRVLSGAFAGTRLSKMSEAELLSFYKEIQTDTDGVALLQSYLDRYHPGWQERAQGSSSTGRATG